MTSTLYTYEQELKPKNIKKGLIEMAPKMLALEAVSEFAKLLVPAGADALDFSESRLRVRTFHGKVAGSHDPSKCAYQWELEARVPENEAFVAVRLSRISNYCASSRGFIATGEFVSRIVLVNRRLGRVFGFNRPELWSIEIPSNYFMDSKIPEAKHGDEFIDSILQDFIARVSEPRVVSNFQKAHYDIRNKLAEANNIIRSFI